MLATNTANFTTLGPLIRLRAIPSSTPSERDLNNVANAADDNEPAAVHATSTPFEAVLPSTPKQEINNAQYQSKRVVSGRRNSPAAAIGEYGSGVNAHSSSSDEDESPGAIQRLTERLNLLRTEKEKVDRETAEEEEESKRHFTELSKERDKLRQEYKEKEEASAELRKHGNYLDKLNRTAQSKKAAKEKQLQQKRADRQKIKDDIARWEKETAEMKQDTEDMINERADVVASKDREVVEIRQSMSEDVAIIKSLEEEIRVKGAQIKAMEKEQEKKNTEGMEGQDMARNERGNDQAWEARVQGIQNQLGTLWHTLQQTQLEQQQAEEHLAWWMAKRARNPEHFASIPSLDFTSSIHRSRSRRSGQPNSRTSTISSPAGGYQSGVTGFNGSSTMTSPFSTTSPFFNMSNGMSVSSLMERTGLSHTDAELLTGGGPMSPAASNLLPSNLFRDEDNTVQGFHEASGQDSTGTNGPTDFFLGHALTNSDVSARGLHTPASASSRTGSVFPSPHESSQNLPGYPSRTDPFMEGDQHPSSSTSAPFHPSVTADSNPLATSRLANLFSSTFNRQRGKPGTQEPPLLGTLKQGQSHSFPRNLEQETLDLNGSRRRKGSHGNWANPMAGLLTRNTDPPRDSGLITARTGSGRRSRLNMFAPKIDGLESFSDQHPSSRPSSTYSFDQIIARQSTDSQRFGWAVSDGLPNRSSPLGGHWSSGPWAPSRRPSLQHGSTSNLSVGSTPLDPDAYPGPFPKQSSEQAPIGTRPRSSQRPVTPKLNPAAPAFNFLKRAEAKKTAKAEKLGVKSVEKGKDKANETGDIDDADSMHESSPPPRLSRDAQSITTAASTADSHDSFDRSTSGTPSEAVTPSGPKETLMQKITRKSSSSKFNVPWSKERGFFSKRAGEPSTTGDVDEDASSENQLGKSAESASSTPQQEKAGRSSLSWPNIRRKAKKGDQAVNEGNERSSETGDDDDA